MGLIKYSYLHIPSVLPLSDSKVRQPWVAGQGLGLWRKVWLSPNTTWEPFLEQPLQQVGRLTSLGCHRDGYQVPQLQSPSASLLCDTLCGPETKSNTEHQKKWSSSAKLQHSSWHQVPPLRLHFALFHVHLQPDLLGRIRENSQCHPWALENLQPTKKWQAFHILRTQPCNAKTECFPPTWTHTFILKAGQQIKLWRISTTGVTFLCALAAAGLPRWNAGRTLHCCGISLWEVGSVPSKAQNTFLWVQHLATCTCIVFGVWPRLQQSVCPCKAWRSVATTFSFQEQVRLRAWRTPVSSPFFSICHTKRQRTVAADERVPTVWSCEMSFRMLHTICGLFLGLASFVFSFTPRITVSSSSAAQRQWFSTHGQFCMSLCTVSVYIRLLAVRVHFLFHQRTTSNYLIYICLEVVHMGIISYCVFIICCAMRGQKGGDLSAIWSCVMLVWIPHAIPSLLCRPATLICIHTLHLIFRFTPGTGIRTTACGSSRPVGGLWYCQPRNVHRFSSRRLSFAFHWFSLPSFLGLCN